MSAVRDLLALLADPALLAGFSGRRLETVLACARRHHLSARLAADLLDHAPDHLPARAREVLAGERLAVEREGLAGDAELRHIERRLDPDLAREVVLLKGAAWRALGSPVARGRRAADIDIMVPRHRLAEVEAACDRLGYAVVAAKRHPQDEAYYRDWMHELPPRRHIERGQELDLHHAILPPVHRQAFDPALLFAAARSLAGRHFRVLAPVDRFLHSAVHAWSDAPGTPLRNLLEQHDMLLEHRADAAFICDLPRRAAELGLLRPAFYAVWLAGRHLATPVPGALVAALGAGRPPAAVLALMTGLTDRLLLGDTAGLARLILIGRAHWLRLPPHLLVLHAARKLRRRLAGGIRRNHEKEGG